MQPPGDVQALALTKGPVTLESPRLFHRRVRGARDRRRTPRAGHTGSSRGPGRAPRRPESVIVMATPWRQRRATDSGGRSPASEPGPDRAGGRGPAIRPPGRLSDRDLLWAGRRPSEPDGDRGDLRDEGTAGAHGPAADRVRSRGRAPLRAGVSRFGGAPRGGLLARGAHLGPCGLSDPP